MKCSRICHIDYIGSRSKCGSNRSLFKNLFLPLVLLKLRYPFFALNEHLENHSLERENENSQDSGLRDPCTDYDKCFKKYKKPSNYLEKLLHLVLLRRRKCWVLGHFAVPVYCLFIYFFSEVILRTVVVQPRLCCPSFYHVLHIFWGFPEWLSG